MDVEFAGTKIVVESTNRPVVFEFEQENTSQIRYRMTKDGTIRKENIVNIDQSGFTDIDQIIHPEDFARVVEDFLQNFLDPYGPELTL